jgi:3-deoxy-D-manno-octulosonic-acid transferase
MLKLIAYQALSTLAGLLGWPYFYWHLKSRGRGESFLPRLGLKLPPDPPSGSPRIWIHGVSVGEVLSALPLVQELKRLLPQVSLTVSTGTETGQAVARRHFPPLGVQVCYYPLDLPWAVRRYLDYLRPDVYISLDSEIWPNFLSAAHKRGVRLALLNARLSDQSFTRLLKYKRYLYDIINLYDLIAAGSSQDYERLRALALPDHKLHLTGNLKIDRLMQVREEKGEGKIKAGGAGVSPVPPLATFLSLTDQPVFLAASTHAGEEDVVLAAYEELKAPYPALLLLLAPRHPERAGELGRLLEQKGLAYHLWHCLKSGEENRTRPVVLIDTIGDLFSLYGVADVAFVGGSLVPHGGQNILEAAAWGLAPLYGPHLENFRWAQAILEEAGAGLLIQDAPSLTAGAQRLLAHPDLRRDLGRRAQNALSPHQGAARRQAELVVELLGN